MAEYTEDYSDDYFKGTEATLDAGGIITLAGGLQISNPAWLLIDDNLTWIGEWDATYGYDIDDVVLHKSDDGNEWHVFVSKISHNVGNVPTSSAAAWRRLYQEQWHGNK